MNLYEIINTETGEILISAISYTEAQRYMQTNNLNKNQHEIKMYMPTKRKTVEVEEVEEVEVDSVQEALKNLVSITSSSSTKVVTVRFKTQKDALAALKNLQPHVAKVVVGKYPDEIKYLPN